MFTYYAHSREDLPEKEWQTLQNHLESVAELASNHSSKFNSADWGYIAGLWHDLGKGQDNFQKRLRGEKISAPHAILGAKYSYSDQRKNNPSAIALALVIAGHHAGLHNWTSGENTLYPILNIPHNNDDYLKNIPSNILGITFPTALPPILTQHSNTNDKKLNARRFTFWVRMLYSSLVDADWLDTEHFMDPKKSSFRGNYETIQSLYKKLQEYYNKLYETMSQETLETVVNKARKSVLDDCIERADTPQGIFTLNAPTGCGKTLASMMFALKHAVHHNLDRIIIVLPYTSIISQNAKKYREIFGIRNVIEHHTNMSFDGMNNVEEIDIQKHRLAEENWDAPVIVTTNVQFFESLHASKPGRCRKLHRIANSVVILDEVQSLPPDLLLPILDTLNELNRGYKCTIVLSSATQPAITKRTDIALGLEPSTHIITNPKEISKKLSRVKYHWPSPISKKTNWEELTKDIIKHEQALIAVDRRHDAYMLSKIIEETSGNIPIHLSALMCPAHRDNKIEHIRSLLNNHKPCIVVATQLIEAGVDLDFPVVYRSLSGLDHIVQIAGRCNREGRLDHGDVYIFNPEKDPPPGELGHGAEVVSTMLAQSPTGTLDLFDPKVIENYFIRFYGRPEDQHGILKEAINYNFHEISAKFKMISDNSVSVVCPYGDGPNIIEEYKNMLKYGHLNRDIRRRIQRYIVQLYTYDMSSLVKNGFVAEIDKDLYEIMTQYNYFYNDDYGLQFGKDPQP